MSADNITNISAALAQTFAPELTRNWNRSTELLKHIAIKPGSGQGGGQNVAWDVMFDGATAASFAEGSDVGAGEFSYDPIKPAVLPWGLYRAAFQLSNLEIDAASANVANATALEDMVGERFVDAVAKICSKINIDLISGTGLDGSSNPTIVGLVAALAATGTYAGLSKGTYPTWGGNVSANGGVARSLTMGVLAGAEQLAYVASGRSPSLFMGTPGSYTKYEGLFEATRRTADAGQQLQGYYGTVPAGDNRLNWRGMPVLRDKDITTGTFFMLNPDELEFRVLPWSGAADGAAQSTRAGMSSNGRDMAALPLPLKVYPLARTGSAQRFVVEVACQLKVKRPSAHVTIQDISEV
jgi:hypothetical protein